MMTWKLILAPMQMLWVLGLVLVSRLFWIACTKLLSPWCSLSWLVDVAKLYLELALPAHFVGRIGWSSCSLSCQWLLKRALWVLSLHQRGASRVCDGVYLREMQVLLPIAPTLSSLLCSHGLLGFDELFCIIDWSHDVVVSGLLHHVLASTGHRSSVPPWRVNVRILRASMYLISLVADEATLIDIFSTRALPIDWWGSIPLVWVLICIPGAPHCFRELWLLFEGELEASQLWFGKLFLDFFLEVDELCLNFWIDISWLCEWSACQGNNVALRSPVLNRCRARHISILLMGHISLRYTIKASIMLIMLAWSSQMPLMTMVVTCLDGVLVEGPWNIPSRHHLQSPHRKIIFLRIVHFASISSVASICHTTWSWLALVGAIGQGYLHVVPIGQNWHLWVSMRMVTRVVVMSRRRPASMGSL